MITYNDKTEIEVKSNRGYYLGYSKDEKLYYYLVLPEWACGGYWSLGWVQGYKSSGSTLLELVVFIACMVLPVLMIK